MKTKKAIVIGAGIGGLATAIRLTNKGYSVDVFETNNYPGGKLSQIELNDYRFDAGPSLFTMPELVEELITLSGKKVADYIEYERLDEVCRYFYDDKTQINAYSDKVKFAKEIENKTGEPKENVIKHLNNSEFIYKSTAFLFLERSLHKIKSYLDFKVLVAFLKLPFLSTTVTMHNKNKSRFKSDKLVQLFDRYATYNGSNPYKAPGILNIIPHLEFSKGAFIPKGGMISITNALYNLAIDLGVNFHFNEKVEEIISDKNEVKGIKTPKTTLLANMVVSNMDVYFTFKKLLPKYKIPNQIEIQERSSSALIFYWGIKKSFKNLILHNILFSKNYKEEFNHLALGKVFNDPTVYINITKKHINEDAPLDCENWFVMINVPSNKGQNWDLIIKEARENIINKINKTLDTDIGSLIECEEILNPELIESKTSSYQGSLYGTASNSKFAAFFRHPNFSSKIKNLYFCGGSVHPGGGIPLALSSAKIIDSIIDENHN